MWQTDEHKSEQAVHNPCEHRGWERQFCAGPDRANYQENLNSEICVIVEPFSQVES